ncbi:MAG: glycosyltransferase [Dehalococcoidales bacterium]|nr:glycosyltransferase [Dehalococcoidales bacterium]
MAEQPLLSIVITSYTTERLSDIYELLDSIKTQSYPNLETIFVAERSTELVDRVKTFAREKNMANLKVIFNDGEPGLSAARNLGIKEAKGEIIAFVDDDTVLFPDWAEAMVKAYENDAIIGVTGPALPLWEDKSMSWFPEEFYWIISCTAWADWQETREVRNAWGMNMSFRKEVFPECGSFLNEFGYHKGPMAEDNEFSLRVKTKTGKSIVYSPNVRLWHRVHRYRLSQRFIRERAYWIGRSRRMLRRYHTGTDKNEDFLSQEHELQKRILTRLLPDIARGFLRNPAVAWRKLSVTTTALYFVVLGYYFHLPSVFSRTMPSGGTK